MQYALSYHMIAMSALAWRQSKGTLHIKHQHFDASQMCDIWSHLALCSHCGHHCDQQVLAWRLCYEANSTTVYLLILRLMRYCDFRCIYGHL
jgi:hypothetical protein